MKAGLHKPTFNLTISMQMANADLMLPYFCLYAMPQKGRVERNIAMHRGSVKIINTSQKFAHPAELLSCLTNSINSQYKPRYPSGDN